MKKEIAEPRTGEEAEEFAANGDLTEYDLSEFRSVLFEFQLKSEHVTMRFPRAYSMP